MLINVLTQLASDTGLHPTQQRNALLELLNNAARELYSRLECNRILREVTLVVPPDAIISLPSYIGELRGMRIHTSEIPFDLNAISSPRYVANTLQYRYKNWRDLGDATCHTIPEVGPLKICIPQGVNPDGTTEVLIAGETSFARQIEETVLLDEQDNETDNLFGPEIYKIACITNRNYDIIVKDYQDVEIARLYNNDQKTRYKLIDVSEVFWPADTSAEESLIDVCYKVPLVRLINDSDSFPAGDDYDTAWYHMAMWVYLKPQSGKEEEAKSALQAALMSIEGTKTGSEGDIIKKLSFGRNKFYNLFRKFGYTIHGANRNP